MAATASNQPSKANQDSMSGGEVETSLEQLEALKQKLVNQLEEGEVIDAEDDEEYFDDISDFDEAEAFRPESECANSELVKNTDDLLGSTTNTPSAAVNNNSETQQKPVSMSRLLTDEEIQKILTRSSDDASDKPVEQESVDSRIEYQFPGGPATPPHAPSFGDDDEEVPASPPRCDSPVATILSPDMSQEELARLTAAAQKLFQAPVGDIPPMPNIDDIHAHTSGSAPEGGSEFPTPVILATTSLAGGELNPVAPDGTPLQNQDDSRAMMNAMAGLAGFLPEAKSQNPTELTTLGQSNVEVSKPPPNSYPLPPSPSSSLSSTASGSKDHQPMAPSKPKNTVWSDVLDTKKSRQIDQINKITETIGREKKRESRWDKTTRSNSKDRQNEVEVVPQGYSDYVRARSRSREREMRKKSSKKHRPTEVTLGDKRSYRRRSPSRSSRSRSRSVVSIDREDGEVTPSPKRDRKKKSTRRDRSRSRSAESSRRSDKKSSRRRKRSRSESRSQSPAARHRHKRRPSRRSDSRSQSRSPSKSRYRSNGKASSSKPTDSYATSSDEICIVKEKVNGQTKTKQHRRNRSRSNSPQVISSDPNKSQAEIRRFFVSQGICYSCGEDDHSRADQCWVRNPTSVAPPPEGKRGTHPCTYCGARTHVLGTCPRLHGRCASCDRCGHIETECRQKSTEEWLVKYVRHAAYGLGTGSDRKGPFYGRFGFGKVSHKNHQFSAKTVQLVKDFHKELKSTLSRIGIEAAPLNLQEVDKLVAFKPVFTSSQPRLEDVCDEVRAKGLPADQQFVLQNFFDQRSQSPRPEEFKYLSTALYLSQGVVEAWFRMARATKSKKYSK